MAGYSFWTWVKRQKELLKLVVSGAVVYVTALLANIAATPKGVFILLIVGVVAKMLTDAVDYWLSDVPMETKP